MAKLTTGQRAALPASTFAGPGRSYPIPDAGHARAAIVDSSRAVSAGNISPAMRALIVARAEQKLRGAK
jgi:hypothetical protein